MTTFTTEDRVNAVVNVEPIPFAGLVTITETPKYKDLTDEEIRLIHEKTDGNLNLIEFARAILRKAQEK
jgi:hypothetical protein